MLSTPFGSIYPSPHEEILHSALQLSTKRGEHSVGQIVKSLVQSLQSLQERHSSQCSPGCMEPSPHPTWYEKFGMVSDQEFPA